MITKPSVNPDTNESTSDRFDPLPFPLCEYPDLGHNPPPPDPERDQRHIKALGQAMVQRYTSRGGNPKNMDLLYWLHDADALDNADAIKRWVRRMLTGAPPMSWEDKVLFIERLLSDTLAETR